MAGDEINNSLGKKVFFLYPSALTQNQIISELAQEEFEVYTIKNESKIRQILSKYPESILFANINEGLKESAWVELIQSIQKNSDTGSVDIGIIASSNDDTVRRKYTELLKVRCGYTVIKSDLHAVTKQLVTILNAMNAKGRRKYIRMVTGKESTTTVNLPMNGTFVNGVIRDISVVGFSCSFSEDPQLAKNGLVGDIQLKLQSQLLKAEGIVFGSRKDETDKVYVFLFTQRVDPNARAKIRKFIQNSLQNRMDEEFK